MRADETEHIAETASNESGLTDRPRADPRTMAVSYCGLRLAPWVKARPKLVDGVIWYPANAAEASIAWYCGHEVGHDLLDYAGVRLRGARLERAASRIGVAVTLPRRAYLRDVAAEGWNLDALTTLWPLASRWVHARRIVDLYRDGAIASRWRRGKIERVVTDGIEVPDKPCRTELELAQHAMAGNVAMCRDRLRAWPDGNGGAIVLCATEDLARAG